MQKPPPNDFFDFIKMFDDYKMFIGMALIGAWGAVVKYLESVRLGTMFRWIDVHISLFSGSFIGLIVGLAMKSLKADDYVIYATIGVTSTMGTASVRLFIANLTNLPLQEKDAPTAPIVSPKQPPKTSIKNERRKPRR